MEAQGAVPHPRSHTDGGGTRNDVETRCLVLRSVDGQDQQEGVIFPTSSLQPFFTSCGLPPVSAELVLGYHSNSHLGGWGCGPRHCRMQLSVPVAGSLTAGHVRPK